jgi:AdoMet-dependent heme synthase
MSSTNPTQYDFGQGPLMFYYEVTQACDLLCQHCRASAQPLAHPGELNHAQSCALLDQVATFPQPPVVVFTGGDPLKRPDLLELIRHARQLGLQIALTPSATPLATREALLQAKEAGISCLGVSLDGVDAATHDAFRGWQGSFDRTMQVLADASELDLPVQVNTTITCRNVHQIDAMANLFADKQIMMWSVFFLVPVGRGELEQRIPPNQYEDVFEKLWYHSQRRPYAIKTTEAPHYRRFVLEHDGDPMAGPAGPNRRPSRPRKAPLGVGDGKGVMFVGHTGEIFPAGFLPLTCGRFPADSVVDVYQHHPTFVALRDPSRFGGKCGVCEYRDICGGSRARAFAVTGDPLAEEPDCVYTPVASDAQLSPS